MRFSKIIFSIWVFFWIFFLIRALHKGEFEKFKALLSRSPEARRAYVLGEGIYEFLQFSLENTPRETTYKIAGDIRPIDRYRLIYYLYPRKESHSPEYILCYGMDKDYAQEGFYKSTILKNDQFVLKRGIR